MTAPMKYNPAFLDDETLMRTFVARHAELELILEILRESQGPSNQHILIIGARGTGKTTLALRVAAEIRRTPELDRLWRPVAFGEESYQVSTPGELWLEALVHLGTPSATGRDWREVHERLRAEPDEERLRERALAALMDFADEQKKRLLMIVENLHMIIGGQMKDDDAWVLRHTLSNEPRVLLLATATSRFKEIDEYKQALYEMFRIVELKPLEDGEARAVWESVTGRPVPKRQIRPIQILTGGNPRLIRILSEFAADTSFQDLMDNLIQLVDEHTEYFKSHLDNLAPQERRVFVALADLWDPSTARAVAEAARLDVNTASALLKRLEDRGAVTVYDQRGRIKLYHLAERMYNIYHLLRRRGPASARVQFMVRFIVAWYHGDELLRIVSSLASETIKLPPEQRERHFAAYDQILEMIPQEDLRCRVAEETGHYFLTVPDAPGKLKQKIVFLSKRSEEVLNDPEKTLAALERVLELNPQDARAWFLKGAALGLLGRLDEAIAALERALELDPEDVDAWRLKGTALMMIGMIRDALTAGERMLEINNQDVDAWRLKGLALVALGETEEALFALKRATDLEPWDGNAWRFLGWALARLRRFREASEAFNESVRLSPRAGNLHLVAWCILDSGHVEALPDAESYVRRAIELESPNSLHHYTLARILGAQGRWREALDAAQGFLQGPIRGYLASVISFFVEAAAGHSVEARRVIEASPSFGALEPLTVALAFDQGERIDAALEIQEVARDLLAQIQAKREGAGPDKGRKRNQSRSRKPAKTK